MCQILLLLCLWLPQTRAADDEMPIIAYWGVPDFATGDDAFRTFSECGFTVSLYPYSSYDKLVEACRVADKYGVRIIGRCPEVDSKTASVAQKLKGERGFYGYLIQDEPSVPQMREQQKLIRRIRSVDSTHCFYLNLFPIYNPNWIEPSTKARNYQEYLKAASSTSCQQISFDHYPITTKGIRQLWYYNLEMVRREALSSGKPFWGFALSVPHEVPNDKGNRYPVPTMSSLRLQVYANLAYGAQGIQYFTYWTPADSQVLKFHNAPVSEEGHKTKTYALVQAMNRELKSVARLFYGAKVLSVGHLGAIPEGTVRQTKMPENIRSLKIKGRPGALISQFEKDGHRYMAVVNKSHEKPMIVRLRTKNSIPRFVTKDLQEITVKSSYTVESGDILMFRLK